jgi:hypothetical protein
MVICVALVWHAERTSEAARSCDPVAVETVRQQDAQPVLDGEAQRADQEERMKLLLPG